MAENQSTLERIGLTPPKAALMGVLAIALVGVICYQYGGSEGDVASGARDSEPRGAVRRPATTAPRSEEQANVTVHAALAVFDQSRWKSPELTEVIAYDPFALPAAFPQPPQVFLDLHSQSDEADDSAAAKSADQLAQTLERMSKQLKELQQRGVQVIVSGRDQYVAMIGDRMIHVGDEINGFTVTAIEPDGVRVEMKGLE